MIRTRKITDTTHNTGQAVPALARPHVRLRSPERGRLIGIRLQPAEIAELERRCRPGQSLADVVRQELRRAFTKP